MPRPALRALAALFPIGIALLPLSIGACHRTGDGDAITSTNDPTKAPPKSPKPPKTRGPEPKLHRAEAVACAAGPTKGDVAPAPSGSASAAPGTKIAGPGAACSSDAECTKGKNGRCAMTGGGRMAPRPGCVYDQCFADADCGANSECVCGGRPGSGNHCRAGNCATDTDCGGSYCSPSYGTSCGPFGGYHGNYCHTSDDECTSDDDCPKKGGEHGYCAWYPEASRWKCGYNHCVG